MEYNSPSFSSFRPLMDLWDESTKRHNLEKILNGKSLIFFFKKGDDFFGAPEEERLSFARLMNPDEEEGCDGCGGGCGTDTEEGDANITMFHLKNLLNGSKEDEGMQIFHKKDLDDINVLGIDDILTALMKRKNYGMD